MRARERDLISGERFNFDRMRGLNNHDFTKIISSITAISSIDHKMKFSLIADRSMRDDQIGDSIMIAQP